MNKIGSNTFFSHKHLLGIEGLSADEISFLLDLSESHVEQNRQANKKRPLLQGQTVINLFFESSTRTRTSFELACKRLGADVINMSVSTSAIKKGETLLDTAMTLNAMHPDVLVVRHPDSGAVKLLSEKVTCSVINAGDGSHEHPTQALLDALTIRRRKKKLQGLRVAICGDVLHSRVARSNIHLLNTMGASVCVVAPVTLLPHDIERLGVEVFHDMAKGLEGCDIVMMLRLQRERMNGNFIPSLREYFHFFGLDAEKLARAKPDALIMHPGPMNRGVEIDSEVADDIARSVIHEQVEMGVAVRMACLETIIQSAGNGGGGAVMSANGKRTAYVNARLLDPASGLDTKGALLTEGAEIRDLGPKLFADGVPEGVEHIDCKGHCLAPGLIDARVQLGEPGYEHKETMTTASLAAGAGGVTTMLCLPNTDPVIDEIALVELVKRRARDAGPVNIHPYAAITKGLAGEQITEMGLLAEAGAVAFTDGTAAVGNAMTFRRALDYALTFDLLIVQHPEDPDLANGGVMNEGELATRLGLAGIPTAAETILLERDLRLLELTGGRYHVAHLSTADAIDAVRRAKEKGLNVTCETAPPYFALNETAVGDYRTFAKLSPPLRNETDRKAVIEGLKDGTIDLIASDHAPHDQDSKRLPFVQAENGIVGLETLLPLTLELYHNGSLPLLRALEAVTVAPARVFRLAGGVLAKGKPADLVLFDLEKPRQIDVEKFHSKSKNSPFDGRPVQGVVLRTVANGQPIFVQE